MRLRKQKSAQTNDRRQSPDATRPAVFSYYARGSSNSNDNVGRNEDRTAKQRLRYRFRLGHAPSYIALVMLLVALGYSLWLRSKPHVVLLQRPATIQRSSQTYQAAIEKLWNSSLWNHTKLTVNTVRLQQQISDEFHELASVQVELPLLGQRPTVVLTPASPTLRFISANGVFYVDSNGMVMANAANVTQNQLPDLPQIHDETGLVAEAGKRLISQPEASFLQKLAAQVVAAKLPLQSITLPAGAANEADVRITGVNYLIKFSIDSEPRQAVGTYLAVKTNLDANHITPSQYVDVRVDEKVFYK